MARRLRFVHVCPGDLLHEALAQSVGIEVLIEDRGPEPEYARPIAPSGSDALLYIRLLSVWNKRLSWYEIEALGSDGLRVYLLRRYGLSANGDVLIIPLP